MQISNSGRSESYAIMSKELGRVNATIVRSIARSGGGLRGSFSDRVFPAFFLALFLAPLD